MVWIILWGRTEEKVHVKTSYCIMSCKLLEWVHEQKHIVFIHVGGDWYGRGRSNEFSEQYLKVLSLDSDIFEPHLKLQCILCRQFLTMAPSVNLFNPFRFVGGCASTTFLQHILRNFILPVEKVCQSHKRASNISITELNKAQRLGKLRGR